MPDTLRVPGSERSLCLRPSPGSWRSWALNSDQHCNRYRQGGDGFPGERADGRKGLPGSQTSGVHGLTLSLSAQEVVKGQLCPAAAASLQEARGVLGRRRLAL